MTTPPDPSLQPPLFGGTPSDGLHEFRNTWGRHTRYMADQAAALADGFAEAVAATRVAVPKRSESQGFLIDRSERGAAMRPEDIDPRNEERVIEAALFREYGLSSSAGPNLPWATLITFQLPLHDNRDRGGWGHVDLLGVTREALPLVIELKKGSSRETPLRGLIEVLANAVAIQENWEAISPEIDQLWQRRRPSIKQPKQASPIAVQLLAPRDYWSNRESRGRLSTEQYERTRREFKRLRSVAAAHGFPSTLATFDWPCLQGPNACPAIARW